MLPGHSPVGQDFPGERGGDSLGEKNEPPESCGNLGDSNFGANSRSCEASISDCGFNPRHAVRTF
jgi:hypothetical protein